MAEAKRKHGGGKKQHRYGGKQKHGHSRAAYFSQAVYRIAANKRRRIAKDAAFKAKCQGRARLGLSIPMSEGSIPSPGAGA